MATKPFATKPGADTGTAIEREFPSQFPLMRVNFIMMIAAAVVIVLEDLSCPGGRGVIPTPAVSVHESSL